MQSVSMYEGDFIMEKNLEMKSRKKVVSMIHLLFFYIISDVTQQWQIHIYFHSTDYHLHISFRWIIIETKKQQSPTFRKPLNFFRLHETKTIVIVYFSKYFFRPFFFPKHFDSILKFIMTKLLTFNRLFSALKMFCLFSTFLVVFFLSV